MPIVFEGKPKKLVPTGVQAFWEGTIKSFVLYRDIKHLLIRTPLEEPAQKIQYFIRLKQANKYPELQEIYYEPLRIKKIMKQVIGKSSNCIDIGCYLGSVLSQILQLSPQGKHIAFEPMPTQAYWLKKKFPDVDIREIALSKQSKIIPFYVNTNCSGFSGIRQHRLTPNDSFNKIIVQSEKLDNILDSNYRVHFMKIDVEGGELAVLQGAINTLNSYHPLFSNSYSHEVHPLFPFGPRREASAVSEAERLFPKPIILYLTRLGSAITFRV